VAFGQQSAEGVTADDLDEGNGGGKGGGGAGQGSEAAGGTTAAGGTASVGSGGGGGDGEVGEGHQDSKHILRGEGMLVCFEEAGRRKHEIERVGEGERKAAKEREIKRK
jgi:hypothetical protein